MLAFILFLGFSLLFIWSTPFFEINTLSKTLIIAAFGSKLLAAFTVWAIYSFYYSDRVNTDIFKYFDDAHHLFLATKNNLELRWQLILGVNSNSDNIQRLIEGTLHWDKNNITFFNDNRTLIRIHLILLHVSKGFYHFHTLFFALLSFIGSFSIFRFLNAQSKLPPLLLFGISFLIPSFLFWTSAPLKESWLVFSLGIFLYGFISFLRRPSLFNVIMLIIGCISLLSAKFYIGLSLILPILLLLVNEKTRKKNMLYIFFVFHGVILFALFWKGENLIVTLSQKQLEFKLLASHVKAGSTIYISNFSDFYSMIPALPRALFNVILQPIKPPNWNFLTSLVSLEHLIYIMLTISPLFFYRKVKKEEIGLVFFCLSFVLISSFIIGLTTPVIGAIVKYKAPILPFHLLLLFTFIDLKKIKARFTK